MHILDLATEPVYGRARPSADAGRLNFEEGNFPARRHRLIRLLKYATGIGRWPVYGTPSTRQDGNGVQPYESIAVLSGAME